MGWFGGSSSSDKNNTSTPSEFASDSAPTTPPAAPLFGSPSPSTPAAGTSSADVKRRVQTALVQQGNVANAKKLIDNILENCYERCVPQPGSSLSKGESQCLSSCMEKYIDAWNTVSKTYVARLQREGANPGQ